MNDARDGRFGFGPPIMADEEEDHNQVVREVAEEEHQDHDVEYDDHEEFLEEPAQEYYDDSSEEESHNSSFLHNNKRYILLFVVVLGLILAGLFIFGGEFNLEELLPTVGSGEAQADMTEVLSDDSDEQGPQLNVAPISTKITDFRNSALRGWAVVWSQKFAVIMLINLFLLVNVFEDALKRGEWKDFGIFMAIIGIATVFMMLPIFEYFVPDGQTLISRWGNIITMKMWQNFFIASSTMVAFFVTAKGGVKDYTPLSAGMFMVGTLFWLTQPDHFLQFSLPTETVICWTGGVLVHIFELSKQDKATKVFVATALGIALQVFVFFGIITVIEFFGWVSLFDYAQLIAFSISIVFSGVLLEKVLVTMSKSFLGPEGGHHGGGFENQQKTSAHDGVIALLMMAMVLVYQVWN